jgi:hypothetical protein
METEWEQDETDDEYGLETPTYDLGDHVFRCKGCDWEVVEGICQNCGTEYRWDPVSLLLFFD